VGRIGLRAGTCIWIAARFTNMPAGFNRLAAKVKSALANDPFSGHVFMFRGRRGNGIKLLWSTGDGLCLLANRLEHGCLVWPRVSGGKVLLTPAQLSMLLKGIDWKQPIRTWTLLSVL
jgi:transposase